MEEDGKVVFGHRGYRVGEVLIAHLSPRTCFGFSSSFWWLPCEHLLLTMVTGGTLRAPGGE